MIFVQNVCVFGTILKQIDCPFCCFLNHIICFCKLCYVFLRQGKIPFVPLFIFFEKIVMKASTTKKLICEDIDERNYWNIFKYNIYYLVAHAQTHTHTLKFVYLCHTLKLAQTHHTYNTHTHANVCACVCVCVLLNNKYHYKRCFGDFFQYCPYIISTFF